MLLFLGFRQNVSRETFRLLFSVAHSQIYFHLSIIWCWCQKVFWPLWYQIATCCVLSQSSKKFVIRSFFFKNGYLLMFLTGQKVKSPLASKLASAFWPFDLGIIIFFIHIHISLYVECFTWNIPSFIKNAEINVSRETFSRFR